MTGICLIEVPYDSGRFNERMGAGPRRLLESGLAARLERHGHPVELHQIRAHPGLLHEAAAWLDLVRGATRAARNALAAGAFPLLLTGNCGLGALTAASLLQGSGSVVWFDAHADFNTPETSASGFLDGMSLAMATGRCWRGLSSELKGFQPFREGEVTLVGARALDDPERRSLECSRIRMVAASDAAAATAQIRLTPPAYLHVDVDVLDISEGMANTYACEGGLSANELCRAIQNIGKGGTVRIATISAYDPAGDHDGRIRGAIDRIADAIAATLPG